CWFSSPICDTVFTLTCCYPGTLSVLLFHACERRRPWSCHGLHVLRPIHSSFDDHRISYDHMVVSHKTRAFLSGFLLSNYRMTFVFLQEFLIKDHFRNFCPTGRSVV